MKYLCIIFSIFLIACKAGEGIENDYSHLRTDGFYAGINPYSSVMPDTMNRELVKRNVCMILRFYSPDSGVIVQEGLPADFQFNDSTINMYYNWCRDFETKNPGEKEFVNFRLKLYGKDSIRFSQIAPNTRIDYKGKIFKDSIELEYVIYPVGLDYITPLPPKPIHLKFHSKKA